MTRTHGTPRTPVARRAGRAAVAGVLACVLAACSTAPAPDGSSALGADPPPPTSTPPPTASSTPTATATPTPVPTPTGSATAPAVPETPAPGPTPSGPGVPPPGTPPPASTPGPDGRRGITVDGVERSFLERVPQGPVRTLVVDLHGLASSPEQQRDFTGLDAVADAEGWLVLRPAAQGPLRLWDPRTDVAFVAALLDLARAEHGVPDGRTVLVGFSAGGVAAGVLADLLDARVGAVVGIAAARLDTEPVRTTPLAVLGVATLDDPIVPHAATVEFVQTWARHGGCERTTTPTTAAVPVTTTWSGCAAPVALLSVPGPAGHVVPDTACCDVDLSATIAAFVRDALA